MDYFAAFRISASGMAIERLRLDVATINLANMHSTAGPDGRLFQPLRVLSAPVATDFKQWIDATPLGGVETVGVVETTAAPHLVFDPGHSQADTKGFVAYPGVDHLNEMLTTSSALRAYEANVAAMNAAKAMATRALDIGGGQ